MDEHGLLNNLTYVKEGNPAPEWPDVEIKRRPNFTISCQKGATTVLT